MNKSANSTFEIAFYNSMVANGREEYPTWNNTCFQTRGNIESRKVSNSQIFLFYIIFHEDETFVVFRKLDIGADHLVSPSCRESLGRPEGISYVWNPRTIWEGMRVYLQASSIYRCDIKRIFETYKVLVSNVMLENASKNGMLWFELSNKMIKRLSK